MHFRHILLFSLGCMLAASTVRSETLTERVEKARGIFNTDRKKGVEAFGKLAEELEATCKKKPAVFDPRYQLARIHFYLEDDAKALKGFQKCLALKPKHAPSHYYLGMLHAYAKRPDQAALAFITALKTDPKEARYWYWLGRAQEDLKQEGEALKSYQEAIALSRRFAPAFFRAGVLLSQRGKDDEALEMYRKASTADPKHVTAHFNMGIVLQMKEQYREALAAFMTVVRLNPDDWRSQAKLIQLHHALSQIHQRDAAREAIFELHRRKKVDSPFFCREQFPLGGKKLMVFEYFELKGPRAVRYVFHVLDAEGQKSERRISLGSYEVTNALMRERGSLKKGERIFHLDGYGPKNSHRTYGFFEKEPSYEDVRAMVGEVLSGKRKAVSGTDPGNDGTTVTVTEE